MNPYTYYIAWSKHNLHYYGVRLRPKSENDLWVKYFTSSKYVKQTRKLLGEPDIIEIRKMFDNERKARIWECRVLIRLKVKYRIDWLNRCDGKYNGSTSPKSEDHKRKISESNTGKIHHWQNKVNKNLDKIRKTAEKHKGMKRPESTKEKLKEAWKIRLIRQGGAANKGMKIYHNPNNISERIQCLPEKCPIGWIKGNPRK